VGTVGVASVVLMTPDACGTYADWFGRILRSRYTRTVFASAMILVLAAGGLVMDLSSPEIVYKQF
jgi:hypothetical protein